MAISRDSKSVPLPDIQPYGLHVAFSKTGGKLITIDIDDRRHKIALANLKEAGLSEYVDARLGRCP